MDTRVTTQTTHDEHRRRQTELLRRLLQLLAGDPRGLGVVAGGSYGREALCHATRKLLAAYERVCPDYCAKASVPYPTEKVATLHRVLDEFDQLT